MKYVIRNYDDASKLEGTASEELVRESAKTATGAVGAYRDDAGVWQYVPESQTSHYERNLRTPVTTVYVEVQSASAIIREAAARCAAEQIAQGWTAESEYHLGVYYGDQEALEEALGRKATREELLAFESDMRHVLSGKGVLS